MNQQRTKHLALSLLAAVAFAIATSGGASAQAPAAHALRQNAVGNPAGPYREIFGFALGSSLSDPTYGYPSWNFSLLSTVAYFGLHVQNDGSFASDSDATVWNSSQLTSLVSTAHAHGTRVVLTIILQDFSSGTPSMCAGLSHTATTVSQTLTQVKAKGVDGVNVDYEGLNGSCGTTDPSWARHAFTSFVATLRSSLPGGSYLTVDTYASSATDSLGFFDVGGLAPSVDAFFVMAYDLEYSNYYHPPTSCTSFCLGPTAPLAAYYYNDASVMSQYLGVVAPSKVILGVPYYGRKSCVSAATPNAVATSSVVADTYLDAMGESTAAGVQAGSYASHRDANDPSGGERWDTWFNTTLSCTRELYFDDAVSLGAKYDLVNRDNLRGMGMWTLNYGGGAPELWSLLAAKFATTTPWSSLGGILTSGPAASSWGASRTDVFVRGTDNGLWQSTWNGTAMTGWSSLGGILTSDPAAVSWGANRIDVFGRGTDNGLWYRTWNGTAWGNWQSLGGILTTGPAVTSTAPGRLDVFVRGTDNGLWQLTFDSAGWHNWVSLGGILTADPGAIASAGRIDVFARGTDYGLWHRWWDSSGWHNWDRFGGLLSSQPAASSCAAGHMDVFAMGSDRALYQLGFNGTAWGSWQRLGGQWTAGPGAVCPPGTTSVTLLERGSDAALWQTSVPGS